MIEPNQELPAAPPPPAPVRAADPPPSTLAVVFLYLGGLVTVAVAAMAVYVVSGEHRRANAEEIQVRQAALALGPRVRVATVTLAPGSRSVALPGEIHAWNQTTLYAKVSGYLADILVDKGSIVQKGQVLAHIEVPDLDQQVKSAAADLALKKLTADRDHELVKSGFVSAQDRDTADAQLKQSEATLLQLQAMQQYEVVRAPFTGVITHRYADPGSLLPAATGSTQAAQPIVEISQLDKLRVQVYLGQNDAALVKVGDAVRIVMDQRPDVVVDAKVSRLSKSLDIRTRTMLAEIDVDNRKTSIYPGEFSHVKLVLTSRAYPIVPTDALIYKEQKVLVATIHDKTAHFVPVVTGTDDGKIVQITSGLQGGEIVALSASADIEDGSPVQPIDEKAPLR